MDRERYVCISVGPLMVRPNLETEVNAKVREALAPLASSDFLVVVVDEPTCSTRSWVAALCASRPTAHGLVEPF